MTKQTDQSSAELDRVRIAEAMGWTKCRLAILGAGGGTRWPTAHGIPPGRRYEAPCPNYFRSADAALTICEFMKAKGWSVTAGRCDDHPWVMNFWMITGEGDSTEMFEYEENGDTLSQAICRAFLAWMDAQKEAA